MAERCSAWTAEGGRPHTSRGGPQNLLLTKSGDGGKGWSTAGVGVAVVHAAVNRARFHQQGGGGSDSSVAAGRADLGPLGNRQWPAAIVVAAGRSIELRVMRSRLNHWLPHAAGVRSGRRNRQSRRGEHTHKQQYHEQSGGQVLHSGSGRPHTCFYRLTSRE
jgi:hypothetical protein